MADDMKKPSLASAIEPDADDATTEADEGDSSFDASASEAFDALKSGDVEGFKTALRAAISCC